jgi:3-oxoacyl-[acyl-carrier protein] reductase
MGRNMTNLFIIYGSESEILKEVVTYPNSYFIRIHNNNVPKKLLNATDVNSFENFKTAFHEVLESKNVEKIIFLGAAFLTQKHLFMQEKWDDIKKSLDVNILSYVQYCHFLLPFMLKIRSGHFIYLSSFRSTVSSRGISLYSPAKAFGEKFFEVVGKENAAFGVYATSIRMGYFDGRMTNLMGEEKIKKYRLSVGNRRLGTGADLYDAIKFILNAPYTNGGVIELTGGINYE